MTVANSQGDLQHSGALNSPTIITPHVGRGSATAAAPSAGQIAAAGHGPVCGTTHITVEGRELVRYAALPLDKMP